MKHVTVLALVGFVSGCSGSSGDNKLPPPPSDVVATSDPITPAPPSSEAPPSASPQEQDAPAAQTTADAAAPAAAPTLAGTPPGELHEVRRGLYRGVHPDRAGLEHVKSLGVKTILSLQQPNGSAIEGDKAEEVAQEQVDAAALGLAYVSVPMTSWSSHETYDEAWSKVAPLLEKADGIYVHCQHGHDRTGLVIALERVLIEHQTAAAAHQEMVDLGHSTLLFRLDDYFKAKTSGN